MKELDTLTVSKVGQSTLPKWWRDAAGLTRGGLVEVRPVRDGLNSLLLTPKPEPRRGAVGLAKALAECPSPMPAPKRHILPPKLEDSLIAATALCRGHAVVTRNRSHFEPSGVAVVDPLAPCGE